MRSASSWIERSERGNSSSKCRQAQVAARIVVADRHPVEGGSQAGVTEGRNPARAVPHDEVAADAVLHAAERVRHSVVGVGDMRRGRTRLRRVRDPFPTSPCAQTPGWFRSFLRTERPASLGALLPGGQQGDAAFGLQGRRSPIVAACSAASGPRQAEDENELLASPRRGGAASAAAAGETAANRRQTAHPPSEAERMLPPPSRGEERGRSERLVTAGDLVEGRCDTYRHLPQRRETTFPRAATIPCE